MTLDNNSLTFEQYIQKAEKYINDEKENDYEEALKYYEEALLLNPADSLLYNKIGYCYMQIENFKSAIAFFERSIYLNKEIATSYFNLAICLETLDKDYNEIKKNYLKSIEYYKLELERHPQSFGILKNIADSYFNLELYDDSQKYYEQYLKYDLSAEILESLAFSYLYKDDFDIQKALESLQKAIRISDDIKNKKNLYKTMISINYHDLKDYEEVVHLYLKLIDFSEKKEKSRLYFCIAEVYRQDIRDYDTAIEYYYKSIEFNKEYEPAYSWLACTYNYKKEHQKALKYFLLARDLEPNSAMVYNNLVYIYSDIGMYDEVEINLKKALELDPLYVTSLLAMLEVNLILGKDFDKNCINTLLKVYKNNKTVMGEYNMLKILKLAVEGKSIKDEVIAWEREYDQLRQGYSVVAIENWAKKSNLNLKEDILDALKIFKKEI